MDVVEHELTSFCAESLLSHEWGFGAFLVSKLLNIRQRALPVDDLLVCHIGLVGLVCGYKINWQIDNTGFDGEMNGDHIVYEKKWLLN